MGVERIRAMQECFSCKYGLKWTKNAKVTCLKPHSGVIRSDEMKGIGVWYYPLLFDPVWKLNMCKNYERGVVKNKEERIKRYYEILKHYGLECFVYKYWKTCDTNGTVRREYNRQIDFSLEDKHDMIRDFLRADEKNMVTARRILIEHTGMQNIKRTDVLNFYNLCLYFKTEDLGNLKEVIRMRCIRREEYYLTALFSRLNSCSDKEKRLKVAAEIAELFAEVFKVFEDFKDQGFNTTISAHKTCRWMVDNRDVFINFGAIMKYYRQFKGMTEDEICAYLMSKPVRRNLR